MRRLLTDKWRPAARWQQSCFRPEYFQRPGSRLWFGRVPGSRLWFGRAAYPSLPFRQRFTRTRRDRRHEEAVGVQRSQRQPDLARHALRLDLARRTVLPSPQPAVVLVLVVAQPCVRVPHRRVYNAGIPRLAMQVARVNAETSVSQGRRTVHANRESLSVSHSDK